MEKIITCQKAISNIKSGDTVMVGGFGLVGCPLQLVESVEETDIKNLTVISNNLGEPGSGLGKWVIQKRVKKGVGSFFTSNPDVVKAYQDKELEIELVPQGTLAESIRAGGAGIGGFYVKTSVGTKLAEDLEVKEIKGTPHVFRESFTADVALIKAHKSDRLGNLVYTKSARNFNPVMATAAKYVVAEVDEIVEIDELSPEEIVTPHLFVDAIVCPGGENK
ncbi:succinyl-CoA--3-ketoacid-CoA transferase [Halalkalibacillus sediminis]|uniref:Succinyl-CoA--3-ketoacid-CoA transferase n=1 Tax=Halalkalibacillus sediminis TaxID=2018042 RepID=A0A2I0QQX7_9BACI|nr:CoA transferase subunit A [Halalkalibacillus sediminis]PKR76731.1 succinyl-CoA--3-ketoacid-CoA transferase [Halalkalibacillus sediminis]